LPSGTETIALRPGQKIDIGTGTVLEPYEQSPSATTQGAFRGRAESPPTQSPLSTSSPSVLRSDKAGEGSAADTSSDVPTSSSEILERIEALTKAARAAMGRGAVPASP
jgi:hypothetical protein